MTDKRVLYIDAAISEDILDKILKLLFAYDYLLAIKDWQLMVVSSLRTNY
jgi:hypothetical protein